MLASLIIVFREVLEAGLIIGVVLAASRGVRTRGWAVTLGVMAGIAGSALVALFAGEMSAAFEGRGQELFTAAVLLLAVAMLAWHVVWMAQHARELTAQLRELGRAVAAGSEPVAVLGLATAAAVMREGSEVVLFLTGIAMQESRSIPALAAGAGGGLALGAAVSAAVYFGLSAVPLRQLFSVTGALVTLLAAGLAAEAIHQLSNAGLMGDGINSTLWDTSWLLPQDSIAGQILHVLLGYRDRPGALEASAYVAVLAGISLLAYWQGGAGARNGTATRSENRT